MENLVEYFSSLAGLVVLNVIIINWITTFFKIKKGWVKQLLTWVMSVGEAIVGFIFSLGLFVVFTTLPAWEGWTFTVLTGLAVGLVANGIYDIPLTQKLLDAIISLIKIIRHLIKGIGNFPYFVIAVYRNPVVQITCCNCFDPLSQFCEWSCD